MLSRSEERLVRRLARRRVREDEGLFLAEGVRVVEELVRSGIGLRFGVVSPTLKDDPRGRTLVRELEARCALHRVPTPELADLAATEGPQGVLVVAEVPRAELAAIEVRGAATVLALDGVQDPGNFGTLVRCADAFRVAFVAALPGTVDPWNPKAVRAAAGSSFRVPIVHAAIPQLLEWLHRSGFGVYGADAGGTPVSTLKLAQRAALVVGNEGAGLSDGIRSTADALLAVPLPGSAESLNVGVAAGILLYLLTRGN